MPEFNAEQIIGKTLYAKKDLPIWKLPRQLSLNDKGIIWKNVSVKKGDSIGEVYSYVGTNTPNDPLFWMFKTPNVNSGQIGAYFYVEHKEGNFDVKSLREQGVLTTKEIKELKADENKSTGDKITDAVKKGGKYILIAGAIFYAIKMYKEFKK
jgi:hypothetical protein